MITFKLDGQVSDTTDISSSSLEQTHVALPEHTA
jgi:hypothetical protein